MFRACDLAYINTTHAPLDKCTKGMHAFSHIHGNIKVYISHTALLLYTQEIHAPLNTVRAATTTLPCSDVVTTFG